MTRTSYSVCCVVAATMSAVTATDALTETTTTTTIKNAQDTDDMEKLRQAFGEITKMFGSVDSILEAFGLSDMPTAQRYGIFFGCVVFVLTVSAVVALLFLGGSFKRIMEQTESGEATLLTSYDARKQRALLMEHLLQGSARMMSNYPKPVTTEGLTALTKMLLNESTGSKVDEFFSTDEIEKDDESKKEPDREDDGNVRNNSRYIPPYYQQNYEKAYRMCQDKPGGSTLSGRPEARFEAYARGYAGCGPYTSLSYRRSYGRIYESICCESHASDDKYLELFKKRPHDIVGRYARLEPLQVHRHLKELFRMTSGDSYGGHKAYDPAEVWSFQFDGPFKNENEMRQSFIFQRKINEAAFAIINSVTDRISGAVYLTNDDPKNLTVQIDPPIMQPESEGKQEQFEACFLLMDRLFAYGYRRIQISIDSQDAIKRKLASRLGFTLEGVLYRHMVVKDSSRDSNVYSMLNSDWKAGARQSLFRKLYGVAASRFDTANEKREEELDEQQRFLADKKQKEQDSAAASKEKNL